MWPHEKLKRKEKKTITTNNKQGIRWWEEWELAYSQEQKQSCHTPPKKNIFLRSDGPKCVRATLARMCQSLKGPLMKEMAEAWPPKNTSIFLGGWASLGTVFVCVCVGGRGWQPDSWEIWRGQEDTGVPNRWGELGFKLWEKLPMTNPGWKKERWKPEMNKDSPDLQDGILEVRDSEANLQQ